MKKLGLICAAFLALALPSTASAALPSFLPAGKPWGFNANLFPAGEPAGSTRTIDAAVAAGATHMRIGINWRHFQSETSVTSPNPPSFQRPLGTPTGNGELDKVDREYLVLTSRGIKPVLFVNSAPIWASTFHTCVENPVHALDAKKCPKDWKTKAIMLYPARDRFDAYYKFGAHLARRYPAAVIEGSNEPDFQQQFQPQYHPPVGTVASGMCSLAHGVWSVDPSRQVLSSGFFLLEYAKQYMASISGSRCFDHVSLHLSGFLDVRTGPGSGTRGQLETLRGIISSHAPGRGIWITETGMTNTARFNDDEFTNDRGVEMGEATVAAALPKWLTYLGAQPDVTAVMVHSIREGSYGEGADHLGFGMVTKDFVVKTPGNGGLPRWCYIVLSAGNTYPGCEGHSLPAPPQPTAPAFERAPYLIMDQDTQVGEYAWLLFLEKGHPDPGVFISWQRCNALGLACQQVASNKSNYKLQNNDRLNRIKVVVTLSNQNGTAKAETVLSPIID
jgi:hypothetical protein